VKRHALTQHDGRHSRPPLSCEEEVQQDQWPCQNSTGIRRLPRPVCRDPVAIALTAAARRSITPKTTFGP
jgi:hypothetical protein